MKDCYIVVNYCGFLKIINIVGKNNVKKSYIGDHETK